MYTSNSNNSKTINSPSSSSSSSSFDNEHKRETVATIASRLNLGEDLTLAYSLQEEEFRFHYSNNKEKHKNLSKDFKLSRQEQIAELEKAENERKEIARRDEELALELTKKFELEEIKQNEQAKRDEELARQIANSEFISVQKREEKI
uniref:Coiled-coil domain-containing protein n=1 Tax=Meloidogyne floridensis TaxID=298350 RepID=A0A915P8E6_9BILA